LVGSWLARFLIEREACVFSFIRGFAPQSDFFRSQDYLHTELVHGSLEDFNSLENAINEREIDTVFHLGAQAIVGTAYRNPLATFEANIRGTYHLLEASRRYPSLVKRVVIASSDKAYGSSPMLPYTEKMPLVGSHPYDVSKSCTDLLSFSYHHTYGLPVAVARCGNIYGGGDLHWNRLIPGTIRSYLCNEEPLIRSDGKLIRDYVYVEDVAEAYLTLGENLHRSDVRGEAFNFAPNTPYSVLEIVSALGILMNCSHLKPKILSMANGEIQKQFLSYQKAKDILHWSPKFSLEEGLNKTIFWYENYLRKQFSGCHE
jgi:CDP-glucose 4,6-dehydratase